MAKAKSRSPRVAAESDRNPEQRKRLEDARLLQWADIERVKTELGGERVNSAFRLAIIAAMRLREPSSLGL